MKGYVFLSNSSKPSKKEQSSRNEVTLTNVSRPCLKRALDMGYDVWFGTNRANPENLKCELPVHLYDSHTYRSITAIKDNYIAFKNLCNVVKRGNIKVIHCNTPVGGMIGRFVGKKYKVDKVIYTAHGFHFFKGAPLFNRTILKWAEQIMAHWTDAIITMNKEDYIAAKKFHLKKGGKVFFVHGVGINVDEYSDISSYRESKRKELGFYETDIVLISMGDLVARKNYKTSIEAIAKCHNHNLQYIICGTGEDEPMLRKLCADLGVEKQIHFLGFRQDIKELLAASDIFLFSTLQEGLPRSMMEAMASGLPCIVSNIRGNVDLLENGKGGFLCSPTDADAFARAIKKCNEKLRKSMCDINLRTIREYDISVVETEIKRIYKEVLLGE